MSPGMTQPALHTGDTSRFGLMGPGSEGATWVYPPMGSLPAEEAVGVLVQCGLAV